MAAVRFWSEYKSFTGDDYRIEIWDTEHTGDATEFTTGSEGFNLRYEGETNEPNSPILSTSCDIRFYMQNAAHEALITDITASQEGRFLVKILWTASDLPFWYGMVLPDIGSYEEAYYPYVLTIRATDGIATLKDIDYANGTTKYTGKQSLLMHLINCFSKLPYWDLFHTVGDASISSYIDWWENSHTHTSSSSCALAQTYVDHAAWLDFEKGVPEFAKCYDVIRNIMIVMGARVTSANGVFWIEQISYRTATTIIGRGYDKTGALLGTANFSGANIINQTAGGALEAVANYEFMAPLKQHRHIFKSLLRRNFLEGVPTFTESNFITTTVEKPIDSNSNATTLRLTGSINLTISSNSAPGTPFAPFCAIFRVKIKVGTKYCRRPIELTAGYQVQEDYANWSSSPDYIIIAMPITNGFFLGNTSGSTFSFVQNVDFMTPGVPENADNFDFEFSFVSFDKYGSGSITSTEFDFNYSFDNANLQTYSYGAPLSVEDEKEYIGFNDPFPNNSLITRTESMIGTATDPNTVGALWINNSGYELAANWWEGTETSGSDIERLLCRVTVASRYLPNRRLQGQLHGNIVAMSRVWWLGEKWVLLGGTWSAALDNFSGEWMELNYGAGISTSPPIKKVVKIIDGTVPTAPTTGGSAGSTYEITTRPPATILTPLSLTTTDTALMLPTGATSQTVTSLPISEILTDGDLYAGDTVAIINPLSGQYDELTVTATTVAGDTAIAVSGTLNANYPAGSTIFKKPKIGTFSLPTGTTGDILYFNGTSWVVKHIGSSGQTLQVSGGIPVWATPAAGYTDEQAQDAVGGILVDSAEIDFTYNDGTPSISAVLIATGVAPGTYTKLTVDSKGRVTSATTLSASDIPNLPASIITSGVLPVARGGTGLSALGTALQYLRTNAGATAMEWATLAAITGTLTAPRIPYASGAGTLTDTADLQWDNTTKGIRAGAGAGAVVGTYTAYPSNGNGFYAFASVNGAVYGTLENFWNTSNAGNAYWIIKVGGASAGDPFIMFVIASATTWSAGIDNSDSDIFKIGPYQNPGSGVLGLQIATTGEAALGGTPDVALSLRIATAKPLGIPSGTNSTRATGNANANIQWNTESTRFEAMGPVSPYYKPILSYATPTTTVQSAAGTGATASLASASNAISGQVTLTTGTTSLTTGSVLRITVAGNMGGNSFPVFSARNDNAAAQATNFYIGASSVTTFDFYVRTALAPSTTYILNYYTGC